MENTQNQQIYSRVSIPFTAMGNAAPQMPEARLDQSLRIRTHIHKHTIHGNEQCSATHDPVWIHPFISIPLIRAAMSNAAPQMPEGRLPVWIQSLRIRCTSRSAVFATACVLSSNSSFAQKRGM